MLDIDLPISGRKSFLPEMVAKNTPKIRALLVLRRLLVEMQSNIDNRKEVRKAIYEIYQNPALMQALRETFKGYEGYRLPTGKELPEPEAAPASLPAASPSAPTPPAGQS